MRYLSFADCQTEGRVAFNRSKNGSLVGLAGLPLSAAWKLALNLCPFKGEQIWLVIENPPATKPDKPGRGERMTEELNNRPATISNDEEAIAPDSSPATIAMLLDVLEREYVTLLTELSAHLHSPDAAADALHDTYVKLRSKRVDHRFQIFAVRRVIRGIFKNHFKFTTAPVSPAGFANHR